MRKLVYAFAILAAAAISTAAVAKDLKQDQKATAPAVSATQMTDAEMDRVTAGGNPDASVGFGLFTAGAAGGLTFPHWGDGLPPGIGTPAAPGPAIANGGLGQNGPAPYFPPGVGRCNAGPTIPTTC